MLRRPEGGRTRELEPASTGVRRAAHRPATGARQGGAARSRGPPPGAPTPPPWTGAPHAAPTRPPPRRRATLPPRPRLLAPPAARLDQGLRQRPARGRQRP